MKTNLPTLTSQPGSELDEIFAVGVDMGRLETSTFFATVATTLIVQIYKKVKETKGWELLKNNNSSDGRNFESLDEFCKDKLGKSYKRMQELVSNHDSIGQEAFEQAEQIGLRQSDFNLIKALPAPKQELVKQALAEGVSKEDLQRSLRELMAADQAEINTLNEEISDLNREIINHRKHYGQLEANYQAKAAEVRLLTQQQRPGSYHPVTVSIRAESAAMEFGARIHLDELEALYESALNTDAPSQMEHELRVHAVALAVSASFSRVEALYSRLRDELGEVMPIQPDGMLQLGSEEKQKLSASVAMQQDAFAEGKSRREVARNLEEVSKGRGRPVGSKNKPKD